MNTVFFKYLGLVDFKETWDYQESLLNSIIELKRKNRLSKGASVKTKNYLLFCQHPHVYTLGKSGNKILKDALKKWKFDYEEKKSLTNEDSVIVKISNLKK